MTRAALVSMLLAVARAGHAAGTISQDGQILGQLGVNTEVPYARLHVAMSSTDAYGLKVSSPNGDTTLALDRAGRLGVGVASPLAALDVRGAADSGDVGGLFRAGNSTSSTSSSQLSFGFAGGLYRHSLRTRAASAQNSGNAVDFFLWNSTASPATLGTARVLSLEAGVSGSTAAVHVLPVGTPDAELEVSNGVTQGGGRIAYGSSGAHSRRALKSDIRYLEDPEAAYSAVKGLRHAEFRYRGEATVRRGLIFEDAPESIQGPGDTLVFDYRVLELERALKVAAREIRRLEEKVRDLERDK